MFVCTFGCIVTDAMNEVWCQRFIEAWNGKMCKKTELAGAGGVVLSISNLGFKLDFIFSWADDGMLSILRLNEENKEDLPMFVANAIDWDKFFRGEFSAVEGVVEGRIRYIGPTRFVLDYGIAFDEIVIVSQSINQLYEVLADD